MDVVHSSSAQEDSPRLVDYVSHLHRPGIRRQRACLNTRHIHQAADQPTHAVGLLDDDSIELAHLRGVQGGGIIQQGSCRSSDGSQGRTQLVTHRAQELSPHSLQILPRRHILKGHHEGFHHALFREDGCGVKQRTDAAAVWNPQDDLFRPNRLPCAQYLRHRHLHEGDLPARRHAGTSLS